MKDLPPLSKEEELLNAIRHNDLDDAKSLLEKYDDIDVNFKGKFDNHRVYPITFTSLYALRKQDDEDDRILRIDVLRLLLKKGANPNVFDTEQGAYPLMLALHNKNTTAFNILIDAGAKLDVYTQKFGGLLHVFARSRSVNEMPKASVILQQLLSSGAKEHLNKFDFEGYTPLHYLVQTDKHDLIKELIDAGAKIDIKNWKKDDMTPIEIAMKNGHEKTAKFVQEYYQETRATQVYQDLQKVENELVKTEGLSPSARLPFDVAMKIATVKMSPTQRYAFERKMEKKLRGIDEKTPSK